MTAPQIQSRVVCFKCRAFIKWKLGKSALQLMIALDVQAAALNKSLSVHVKEVFLRCDMRSKSKAWCQKLSLYHPGLPEEAHIVFRTCKKNVDIKPNALISCASLSSLFVPSPIASTLRAGKTHHIKLDAILPHPLDRPLSLAREFDLMSTWNKYIVESQLLHAPSIWESTVYAGLWMPFPFPVVDALGLGQGFDLSVVFSLATPPNRTTQSTRPCQCPPPIHHRVPLGRALSSHFG